MEVLNAVASIATLIALVLAIWQLWDARAQAKNLLEIHRSVSTRYIGAFPGYLAQIAETIDRASEELIIFCDFPAYGVLSSPDGYTLCRQAIERKLLQKNFRVTLICLSSVARHRLATDHYGQSWLDSKRRSDPKFIERLARYLSVSGHSDSPSEISADRLTQHLEADDIESLHRTYRGAEVFEVGEYVPLYFWIADRKQAIFAFPGFTDLSIEHGFTTTDSKLLHAFLEVKERYATSKTHTSTNGAEH